MKSHFFRSQKGSAIVVTMFVVTVISLFAVTLFQVFSVENQLTVMDESAEKAYYTAKAGAASYASYISDNPSSLTGDGLVNFINNTECVTGVLDQNNYLVNVTQQNGVNDALIVSSLATVNGIQRRVKVKLRKHSNAEIFNKAIFSKNPLVFGGTNGSQSQNTYVFGDIASNSYVTPPTNNASVTHFIGTVEESYPFVVNEPQLPNPMPPLYPGAGSSNNLVVTKGQTEINQSYEFRAPNISSNGIEVSNNATLVFRTYTGVLSPPPPLIVVVDRFVNKGTIKVVGDGPVKIFVRESFTNTTSGVINFYDSANTLITLPTNLTSPITNQTVLGSLEALTGKLCIYMLQGSTFLQQASQTFCGVIYGPNATVHLNSAGTAILGAVISGTFIGNNNATVQFIQPRSNWDLVRYILGYTIEGWSD